MIIDLLQRRFYEIIKKAADKQFGKDTKIIFVPKAVVEAIEAGEEKTAPYLKHLKKQL